MMSYVSSVIFSMHQQNYFCNETTLDNLLPKAGSSPPSHVKIRSSVDPQEVNIEYLEEIHGRNDDDWPENFLPVLNHRRTFGTGQEFALMLFDMRDVILATHCWSRRKPFLLAKFDYEQSGEAYEAQI